MTRDELQKFRDWADAKLAAGQEPPWAWYQYMKLRETLDAIIGGTDAATPQTGNSLQSAAHQGRRLQLVDATYQRDSAQHHQADAQVQLPM
jgi:hypothetical protein